jgi:hypothetical protein
MVSRCADHAPGYEIDHSLIMRGLEMPKRTNVQGVAVRRSWRMPLRSSLCAGLWAWASLLAAAEGAALVDVGALGAVGDGVTPATALIQRAIDDLSQRGGGILRFPAGRYVSGTILLKDGVTLRLERDAVLLGSTAEADYQQVDPFRDGVGEARGYCFIGAVDAKRVGITGPGTIDGRGKEVFAARARGEHGRRPFLVRFVRCAGVDLEDVHLTASGAWAVHLSQCSAVVASRLSILNRGLANNDGIDIDSCRGVRIDTCDVDSGDDAICLKTTSAQPCSDITVSRCALRSDCAAIKLGTESVGDFTGITIESCHVVHARLGGIKLCSVDGARISDVVISDVIMDEAKPALFVRLGARLKTFRADDHPRPVGTMRNLAIRGLRAITGNPGIVISGIPGHAIDDIALSGITLISPGGAVAPPAEPDPIAENPAAYPEVTMFGRLPGHAVFARHVAELSIIGLTCDLTASDQRAAMIGFDIGHLVHRDWTLLVDKQAVPGFPADRDLAITPAVVMDP